MGDPGDGDDGLGEVEGWRAAQAGHQEGHHRAALGHQRSGNAGGNAPGPGSSASDSAWHSLVQQGGHLVVTILSAQGLKDVCMFGKMSPYAVAWIEPQEKQATPAARNAGKTPSWDAKLCLRLQPHHVQPHAGDHAHSHSHSNSNSHSLSVQIFNGDGADAVLIGGVSIPLQDIVRSRAAVEGEEFISCQLLRPSGRIQGVVNLSVQLLPVHDGHSQGPAQGQGQGQLCSVREEPEQEQEEVERGDGQEAAAACTSNPSSPGGQIQQHQQQMQQLQQQIQQHQHQIQHIQQTQHQPQQVLEHSDSRHPDHHRLDTSPASSSEDHDGQHGEDAWGEQQQQQHHRGLKPEGDAESRHPRRRMSGHFSEVAPDALNLANMGEQGHAPLPDGSAPAALATGPAFDAAGSGDPTGLGVGVGVTGGSLGAAVLVEVMIADMAGALSGGDGNIGHLF